ncbi:MAG: response regulator [Proteobacteria bacterium]|nr:response regulator [Desulfobacteraceae bacterium]MBU4014489.1 response regulator [Pseudomonadota bacterium]MBU4068491.1 response regulator [Pseudomonadota bacterium]
MLIKRLSLQAEGIMSPFPEQSWGKRGQKDRKWGSGKNMMKVLIVDDEEALADLIQEMIERDGIYRVKTAANGEEGYEVFLHFKPDIILTDIQMPMKNGLEMVRDIRNHDPWIKTIYMSADLSRFRSLLEDEKKKYQASFITKPFSRFELLGLLSETMG